MSPDDIVRAPESGVLKDQRSSLSIAERRIIAEPLTDKTLGAERPRAIDRLCGDPNAAFFPATAGWNGGGPDIADPRYQPKPGVTSARVPKLKRKSTLVGGRIFVARANRHIDSLDARMVCSRQLTEADVFNMACIGASKASCPEKEGPNVDMGASPILVTLGRGKHVLSQKSGRAYTLDPDRNGEILWQAHVGRGGASGGIQRGSARDGKTMNEAPSDIALKTMSWASGVKRVVDPAAGGGLLELDIASRKKVWTAAPPACGERPNSSPAQSAALTAIPGVVFSGSVDSYLRAYTSRDGFVIWASTAPASVNGLKAKGGSLGGPGATIAGGRLYVDSGYGAREGVAGSVLLAFSVDGR
jgi:outer membrane protein assembly factor BamB